MSIETMKLALEVLEELNKLSIGTNAVSLPAEIDTAMDALSKSIAEAEKREPVAWLQLTVYGNKLLSFEKPSEKEVHYYTGIKLHDPKNIPLYTHPQPKLRGKNT